MAFNRSIAVAAALLLGLPLAGPASAAELTVAHFAPGAGALRVRIGEGASFPLRYGEHLAASPSARGAQVVRALREDGSVLAEASFTVPEPGSEGEMLLIVGNGSPQAPFEFRTSHRLRTELPGRGGWLQRLNLAIVSGFDHVETDDCDGNPADVEGYLEGTQALGAGRRPSSNNLRFTPAGTECAVLVHPAERNPLTEASVRVLSGDHVRRLLTGDGRQEPYRIVYLREAGTPPRTVEPTADLAGLWYPPDQPAGSAVQISYDRNAPPGQRVSALVLGFDASGKPGWRVIDGQGRVIEYPGGTPDGSRRPDTRVRGTVTFQVHGCGSITLVPDPLNTLADPLFTGADGLPRPWRLAKLFPFGCRAVAPAQEAL